MMPSSDVSEYAAGADAYGVPPVYPVVTIDAVAQVNPILKLDVAPLCTQSFIEVLMKLALYL